MTTVVIVSVIAHNIGFAVGFGVGIYYTSKVIAEGKVKNVKYTG